MIKRVMIKSGFLLENPCFKDRIFEFREGFNVIVGDNGIGKSSLAKTIAAYCGIEKGGWSRINDPAKLGAKLPNHYPFVYRQYSPGRMDAIIEWDGTPTFYNDSDMLSKNDMSWFVNPENSSDGISSEAEQLDVMATKPSSGQYRIHKINKIMQMLQNAPKLNIVPNDILDPGERAIAQYEINYIQSLPRNGKSTIIFDEPEKALALSKQIELFDTIQELTKYFQVIMVCHSPLIFYQDNINFIDIEPGFSDACRTLIDKRVNRKVKKLKK